MTSEHLGFHQNYIYLITSIQDIIPLTIDKITFDENV